MVIVTKTIEELDNVLYLVLSNLKIRNGKIREIGGLFVFEGGA